MLAHIHDKQRGDYDPWACPVDRLGHTLWAVFWITVGWLFLPGINVFLFVLSLVLMIPAMINTRRWPTRGPGASPAGASRLPRGPEDTSR